MLNQRVRSFVRRGSRKTPSQQRAYTELWPQFGLNIDHGLLHYSYAFGRVAPCSLDIGFGSGQSLLALAKAYPGHNFIGVETYEPGIGALLLGIQRHGLTNIKIYRHDAVDVIEKCIPTNSLESIQIFFPDPWQKRRHHSRRLIQADFVKQLSNTLHLRGGLHIATDWEDYACHIMRVLSDEKSLINLAGPGQFAKRSPYRPLFTKFEQRAERAGRTVWELQFAKQVLTSLE